MQEDHRMQSLDEETAALLAAASGPYAPSESKFPAVSDMSCVDGPRVFRVREPCCFTPLRWSRDFDEFLRVIRQVLWKRYSTSSSLHSTTRFSHMFSLGSIWCHVPRTSAERDGTGRRDSDNPRRTRELNEKRNVNCWHNLKSATKPLSKYY